jgi:hypothetical protein
MPCVARRLTFSLAAVKPASRQPRRQRHFQEYKFVVMPELLIFNAGCWHSASLGSALSKIQIAQPLVWEEPQPGKCFRNVQTMIDRHGGEAVYGWALTDFGPHRALGGTHPPPLYRRWLNHVVWRDVEGKLWEPTPNVVIDDKSDPRFVATEFLVDPEATFEFVSDGEWYTRPTRYIPLRQEGVLVTDLLTHAQHAKDEHARNYWLREAMTALHTAGFQPREWKVETVGKRTGSIWLIAE